MPTTEEQKPEPVFVQPKSYKVELEPGKEYYWCACGQSKNQPFCDGSHKGGPFKPKKIVVEEKKTYSLCGCKYTHNEQGFCDGTHRKEEGIRKYNEFLLKANSALKEEQEKLKAQVKSAERKQKILLATVPTAIVAVALAFKYSNLFSPKN